MGKEIGDNGQEFETIDFVEDLYKELEDRDILMTTPDGEQLINETYNALFDIFDKLSKNYCLEKRLGST